MQNSRSVGLWCVVLSLVLSAAHTVPAFAEDELPPPPELTDDLPALEGDVTSGAELPPPPGSEPIPGETPPELSAEAPAAEEVPPSLDELPPLPEEGMADAEMPTDGGMVDVPPAEVPMAVAPSRLSTSKEITDLSMEDRLKSKELVLWLSGGPSYGQLQTKGTYKTGNQKAIGGMGYTAGIGAMIGSGFQAQFDMLGTPRTKRQTVDQAMFGIGPRLGFITLMGLFGVQRAPDLGLPEMPMTNLFSIGAKAGLDIIFSHPENSRVSIGIAPEVFYIAPQGDDGFVNSGVSVSLRIYGYENAF